MTPPTSPANLPSPARIWIGVGLLLLGVVVVVLGFFVTVFLALGSMDQGPTTAPETAFYISAGLGLILAVVGIVQMVIGIRRRSRARSAG